MDTNDVGTKVLTRIEFICTEDERRKRRRRSDKDNKNNCIESNQDGEMNTGNVQRKKICIENDIPNIQHSTLSNEHLKIRRSKTEKSTP